MKDLRDGNNQEQMIQSQIIDRGIRDVRVLAAIRAVPRERFFLNEARDAAFADKASPIGHGQTISQPYIVALMTSRLEVQPEHKVLEIGTGSGYQTAILARFAREIYTVERVKPLLDEAWGKLMSMNLRNIHFRVGDGTLGWAEAGPFDRILIAAAAPQVPTSLLMNQLIDGGIAILPVGAADKQMLVEVHRHGDELETRDICRCIFVPLIGQEGWSASEAAE